MSIVHRYAAASLALTLGLSGSVALAQERSDDTGSTSTKTTKKSQVKAQVKKDKAEVKKDRADVKEDRAETRGATEALETSDAAKGNSSEPSGDRQTDSNRQVRTKTTTVAGEKATNKDEDLDMAIGKTETTAAAPDPGRRDVIESSAERVREGEGRRVTAAPLVGYGFNDLGLGVGARAGYTFDKPIYLGATFMYHGGANDTVRRAGVTDSSTSYLYPGIEAGYDIGIGPVLIRPYAGAAVLFGRVNTTQNGQSETTTERAVMVYPGATVSYILPKTPVFVGGDTRVLLPFANQGPSLTLLGTAGLHL
jgi:hypothetical protein